MKGAQNNRDSQYLCFWFSVLDLNAFERQNKAEGLGMVTEEGSGKFHHVYTALISIFEWS